MAQKQPGESSAPDLVCRVADVCSSRHALRREGKHQPRRRQLAWSRSHSPRHHGAICSPLRTAGSCSQHSVHGVGSPDRSARPASRSKQSFGVQAIVGTCRAPSRQQRIARPIIARIELEQAATGVKAHQPGVAPVRILIGAQPGDPRRRSGSARSSDACAVATQAACPRNPCGDQVPSGRLSARMPAIAASNSAHSADRVHRPGRSTIDGKMVADS